MILIEKVAARKRELKSFEQLQAEYRARVKKKPARPVPAPAPKPAAPKPAAGPGKVSGMLSYAKKHKGRIGAVAGLAAATGAGYSLLKGKKE